MRRTAIAVLVGNVAACAARIDDADDDEPVATPEAPDAAAPQRPSDAAAPPDVAPPPSPTDYLQKVVPVLMITVGGKAITKDVKIPGTLKVIEDHDGTLTGIEMRPTTLTAKIGVELHGSSS